MLRQCRPARRDQRRHVRRRRLRRPAVVDHHRRQRAALADNVRQNDRSDRIPATRIDSRRGADARRRHTRSVPEPRRQSVTVAGQHAIPRCGRVGVRHRRTIARLERGRRRFKTRQPRGAGSERQRRVLTAVSTRWKMLFVRRCCLRSPRCGRSLGVPEREPRFWDEAVPASCGHRCRGAGELRNGSAYV